jgi:hypothetical protein
MNISEKSLKLLKNFSNEANKSTGSSHFCDRERWYDFIINSYVKYQENINSYELKQWLLNENWDEESVEKLVNEYEFAVGMLQHYFKYLE